MRSTASARITLNQRPIIDSFLAVSRRFLGASGALDCVREVARKSAFDRAAAGYCALAAMIHAATFRSQAGRAPTAVVGRANQAQADDEQTTHEVSRLLNWRLAGLFGSLPVGDAAAAR